MYTGICMNTSYIDKQFNGSIHIFSSQENEKNNIEYFVCYFQIWYKDKKL